MIEGTSLALMGMCTNVSMSGLLSRRQEKVCAAHRGRLDWDLVWSLPGQVTGRVGGQLAKLNRGVLVLEPNLSEAFSAISALGVFKPRHVAKHLNW